MGCDIHMWCEVKKTYPNSDVKPEWRTVGKIFKSTYHKKKWTPVVSSYMDGKKREIYWDNEIYTEQPYKGRNYNLFSILADVRNGYGFAGADTGDGFVPIATPRGVPKDASDFYKHEVKDYGVDGHSHSWVSLEELESYNWEQVTVKRGFVDSRNYKIFQKKGRPNGWCNGTNNPTYRQVEWKQTYRESVGSFLTETLPALQKLRKNPDVLDLRLVFFFDN